MGSDRRIRHVVLLFARPIIVSRNNTADPTYRLRIRSGIDVRITSLMGRKRCIARNGWFASNTFCKICSRNNDAKRCTYDQFRKPTRI